MQITLTAPLSVSAGPIIGPVSGNSYEVSVSRAVVITDLDDVAALLEDGYAFAIGPLNEMVLTLLRSPIVSTQSAVTLLTAAAASSEWIEVSGGGWFWHARGTWGGATATLQWSPDDGTTVIDLDADALTDDGAQIVAFGAGHIRVLITGGAGVSLTSDLRGL